MGDFSEIRLLASSCTHIHTHTLKCAQTRVYGHEDQDIKGIAEFRLIAQVMTSRKQSFEVSVCLGRDIILILIGKSLPSTDLLLRRAQGQGKVLQRIKTRSVWCCRTMHPSICHSFRPLPVTRYVKTPPSRLEDL